MHDRKSASQTALHRAFQQLLLPHSLPLQATGHAPNALLASPADALAPATTPRAPSQLGFPTHTDLCPHLQARELFLLVTVVFHGSFSALCWTDCLLFSRYNLLDRNQVLLVFVSSELCIVSIQWLFFLLHFLFIQKQLCSEKHSNSAILGHLLKHTLGLAKLKEGSNSVQNGIYFLVTDFPSVLFTPFVLNIPKTGKLFISLNICSWLLDCF